MLLQQKTTVGVICKEIPWVWGDGDACSGLRRTADDVTSGGTALHCGGGGSVGKGFSPDDDDDDDDDRDDDWLIIRGRGVGGEGEGEGGPGCSAGPQAH